MRPGNAEEGGSQALDLSPAQGGFVDLSFAKPGMYVMVTHKFSDASVGGLGVFQISQTKRHESRYALGDDGACCVPG